MKLSVFFFAADTSGPGDQYRLLREVVKVADQYGFEAAWFPERHFTAFGGGYPNPSVLASAAAVSTTRLRLRAGSVILPLHDPIRVAEEWSVVDNLSGGRAELSFGSGWNVNDFVFAPEVYERRREVTRDGIDVVRRLWRGEAVPRTNGSGRQFDVRTLPRPIQPELPVWLTAQSEPTFEAAGLAGYSVLTNLNFSTPEQLADRVSGYRRAAASAGKDGRFALMVHAYAARHPGDVRAVAEPALRQYLRANLDLRSQFAAGKTGVGTAELVSPEQQEGIVTRGVDRLLDWAALIGTVDECRRRVERFAEADVDELACLVDFGVDHDRTIESLELLAQVCA